MEKELVSGWIQDHYDAGSVKEVGLPWETTEAEHANFYGSHEVCNREASWQSEQTGCRGCQVRVNEDPD